jgi:hypothetical protein
MQLVLGSHTSNLSKDFLNADILNRKTEEKL